jgi:maltose/moltooligosaccharide transporter
MWTYSNGAIASQCFGWDGNNASDSAFQDAGNWVGVCFAIQAVGSMIWATLIPILEKRFTMKGAYIISLLVGAIGFISSMFISNQYTLLISYALIGAAWAAMLAIPFTIITNAISGSKYMGTLLGLFNCTICLPQIVAALLGGVLLNIIKTSLVSLKTAEVALITESSLSAQSGMMAAAGILLVLGAFSVLLIKDKH